MSDIHDPNPRLISGSAVVSIVEVGSDNVVCIMKPNGKRKGFMVFNYGTKEIYLSYTHKTNLGWEACSVQMDQSLYVHAVPLIWTGGLWAIRKTGKSNVAVTEFF